MRAVCGRLKSDYSYSNTIVYNNFPWPVVTEKNREQIEKSAQEILKARTLYPNSNLAALYDPLTMPAELRRAHTANDKAVMALVQNDGNRLCGRVDEIIPENAMIKVYRAVFCSK